MFPRRVLLLIFILTSFFFFVPRISPVFANSKRIEVDLTNQKLYAYEDNNKVFEFLVSSGKISTPTPTGEFKPWVKVQKTKMSGGSKKLGTYYNLPNVPYVVFFSSDTISKQSGYSFHGTYWHSSFGTPRSHGCINLRTSDAKLLYKWVDLENTKIVIYGNTPRKVVKRR